MTERRIGGDLVVESLAALGADTVFGEPGQHALGVFDALARSGLRYAGFRTELNAGFAADGYARTTGRPAPLLVSTGPGALISLAALQEAAAASVPVVTIGSQIPSVGLGGRRRGHLHELRDQKACVAQIVKWAETARHPSQIPSAIAAAWETALTPPSGPVWVEVPEDVLRAEVEVPPITGLSVAPRTLAPRAELIAEAARLLERADRPVILAGGGVVRSGAERGAVRPGGKAARPGRDDVRREGRVPVAAPAVAAVVAGGLVHNRIPRRSRRAARRRQRARRAVQQLLHPAPGRSGHSDRGRPRQAGGQPSGAGHPRRRPPRAGGAIVIGVRSRARRRCGEAGRGAAGPHRRTARRPGRGVGACRAESGARGGA